MVFRNVSNVIIVARHSITHAICVHMSKNTQVSFLLNVRNVESHIVNLEFWGDIIRCATLEEKTMLVFIVRKSFALMHQGGSMRFPVK